MDVMESQLLEPRLGQAQQRTMAFNGIEATAELGENGGLIAGTSADLQHFHTLVHLQSLSHLANHQGLAYSLTATDGERSIGIGLLLVKTFHEQFTRHPLHHL